MRLSFAILPLSAAVLLSACGSAPKKTEPTPPPPTVVSAAKQGEANLAPASASIVSGRIALMVEPGGIHITGLIGGLQPMQQAGFHIHERGDCSAVDASSAGNHFNPVALRMAAPAPASTTWATWTICVPTPRAAPTSISTSRALPLAEAPPPISPDVHWSCMPTPTTIAASPPAMPASASPVA